eukprot:TRINITY_DN6090_c0_g1_i1.p1 TRINITY_DN6090_c0_g1~~TRINITY_DN6090_c0_g1_i1.p1  ORF type:complete len:203 (-),score=-10.82 TRINITY_DN6090_c0_g1_i1:300-851(-)
MRQLQQYKIISYISVNICWSSIITITTFWLKIWQHTMQSSNTCTKNLTWCKCYCFTQHWIYKTIKISPYNSQKRSAITCLHIVCGGSTPKCSTDWEVYSSVGIKLTIDISKCGFASTPYLVSSLHGHTRHWVSTGGSEVYDLSSNSFTVYVIHRQEDGTAYYLNPDQANDWCWHIQWIALQQE